MTYHSNKNLTVVNFVGGPGCGKSTTAADLYVKMKRLGLKVELVPEYAKDMVWDRVNPEDFTEQLNIFNGQHKRVRRLVSHGIDFAIVDSPIFLAILYSDMYSPFFAASSLRNIAREIYDTYDNVTINIDRGNIPYQQWGRNESEDKARELDQRVLTYMAETDLPYNVVTLGDTTTCDALNIVQYHVSGTLKQFLVP